MHLCSCHSPYLPPPPDAEMDMEGRCRIAARHGPGREAGPPRLRGTRGLRAGPAGSFAERIPVSVRRSASRGGLGPGLTGCWSSYTKGSELPASSRWDEESEVTGMSSFKTTETILPQGGREARRYQNATYYKVQRDRFPLQRKPE